FRLTAMPTTHTSPLPLHDALPICRDRASVAVQGELHAAAETGAVDGGEGGVGQGPNAPEQLMPDPAALARRLGLGEPRELLEICARGEDVRLARDHERGPVAGLELIEDACQRIERGAPDKRRLRVVGAVVDRHERERALELR